MNSILDEKLDRAVSDGEVYSFTVPLEAVYLISITAQAKNWAQNIRRLFNDDDLAIQIDGVPFYEYGGKKKEFSSAGSWNGNQLKNTQKTVWYILPLASGSHSITFVADGKPFVESVSVFTLGDAKSGIIFGTTALPVSEKGRLFFDVIIKNVNLQSGTISASAVNSDIQCIIDGQTEESSDSKRYKKFFWRKNERALVKKFSDSNTHTITFIGRGSPVLKQIKLETSGYRI